MAQQFIEITNVGALATLDLLQDGDDGAAPEEIRRPLRPTQYNLLIECTATGLELEVFSGPRQAVFRSPISATGTAAQAPNRQTTIPISWKAASGDGQRIIIRDTSNTATIDVQAVIEAIPLT